jgi:hypothetical protein
MPLAVGDTDDLTDEPLHQVVDAPKCFKALSLTQFSV